MKGFALVLVSVLLVHCAVSIHLNDENIKSTTNDMKNHLRSVMKKLNADPSSSAVNYTWPSWMQGPPSVENRNFSLVDIPDATLQPITQAIEKVFEDFSSTYQDKFGLGIGIVYNGKKIYSGNFGSISMNSTEKPTDDTVISVGSNTKIMTSLLLHILAEAGALKVSDPVSKYFNDEDTPAFKPVNPYDSQKGADAVTLQTLSCHGSGLPRCVECSFEAGCTEEVQMDHINSFPLMRKPLTHPVYCNVGFSLLGHCCERAARKFFKNDTLTYEDLMKSLIFDRLNMTSTGFDYPDDIKARMATGYAVTNRTFVVSDMFAQSLHWDNPTGGLYSTMNDMLNYANQLLAKEGLLSPSGFEDFFLPGIDFSDGVSSYGRVGWETAFANDFRTITKSGLVGGFNTHIVLIPELKLGIFGWVNILSEFASELTAAAANIIVPEVVNYVRQNPPKQEYPDVMDQIFGTYTYQGITAVVIQKGDDSLDTGIFPGYVYNSNVTFVYDKKTTEACQEEGQYYFRFYELAGEYNSWFVETMTGLYDSLIVFKETSGKWTATSAELTIVAEKDA